MTTILRKCEACGRWHEWAGGLCASCEVRRQSKPEGFAVTRAELDQIRKIRAVKDWLKEGEQ